MTEDETRDAAIRLVAMNKSVRALADTISDSAELAQEANEKGLAFACHMLRESLLAYCRAVNSYAEKVLKDDLD